MTTELQLLHVQTSGLPTAARNDFDFWRTHLESILTVRRGVTAQLRALADRTGIPFRTLRNKLYDARKHGMTVWIDKRLAGPRFWNSRRPTGLSTDDKDLVALYAGLNQRSTRSAMKQLRRDWLAKRPCTEVKKRLGKEGADKIRLRLLRLRAKDSSGFPVGWSIDNLARYAPPKIELKSVRIGRSAAAAHRPLVYTGRKGLWVHSHLMLDDKWKDFFVNSLAEKQAGRPLELFSHDLFSAKKVFWGIRIRTRDLATGAYNQLGEKDDAAGSGRDALSLRLLEARDDRRGRAWHRRGPRQDAQG